MPKKKNKGKGHKNKSKRSTWGCPNCAQPNPLSQPNCSMCGERKEQPHPTTNTPTSASSTTTPTRNYQQEAIKKYNEMHSKFQRLTDAWHPDHASDSLLAQLANRYTEALAVYKEESDKPDNDRNIPPPGMSMPRQVLRVISGYRSMAQIYRMNNEQLPSIPKDAGWVVLRLIKFVDESSSPLETGFGICLMNNTKIPKQIQLCRMKWIPSMGKWDAHTWACFLASCLLKCGIGHEKFEIQTIACTHKLRDDPDLINPEIFPRAIAAEFRDIVKADRFKGKLEGAMYTRFEADQDLGMLLNDLALHFDRRIYKVARELGIPNVEDRSTTPALSYIMGDINNDGTPNLIPQDCFGRFWPDQRSYIKARLGTSSAAQKYFPFVMDILNAQKVSENIDRGNCRPGRGNFFDKLHQSKSSGEGVAKHLQDEIMYDMNELQRTAQNGMDFVNKQLPKLVKKLCQSYGYPVPMIYRVSDESDANSMFVSSVAQYAGVANSNRAMEKGSGSIKCCLQCGALKGEREAALLKCPCKRVYFCSVVCQKQAWKEHRKTCTAAKPGKGKKKNKKN